MSVPESFNDSYFGSKTKNESKRWLPSGGLEPPIFGLGDRRLIHWATRADEAIMTFLQFLYSSFILNLNMCSLFWFKLKVAKFEKVYSSYFFKNTRNHSLIQLKSQQKCLPFWYEHYSISFLFTLCCNEKKNWQSKGQ